MKPIGLMRIARAMVFAPTIATAFAIQPERTRPARVVPIDSIVVENAWARPALKGGTGGAYLTLTNNRRSAIRIRSASCECAATTELHISTVQKGMAHMEMLPLLVVTAGASVSLKPGGSHFMLMGLRKAFVKGDSTKLVLHLEDGAQIVVNVAIRTQ